LELSDTHFGKRNQGDVGFTARSDLELVTPRAGDAIVSFAYRFRGSESVAVDRLLWIGCCGSVAVDRLLWIGCCGSVAVDRLLCGFEFGDAVC